MALAHAGVWYGLSRVRDVSTPPRPLTVIEATLLAPPPAPTAMPRPLPVVPPPPQKAPPPPRPQPAPTPLPVATPAVPLAEPPPVQIVAAPPAAEAAQPLLAPPPPAPAPAPPAPPVVEAPRFNAAYLNNPPPVYPATARRRGIEGRVMVRAEVQADGTCSRVELKQGSGHELLDRAALEAVKKWRFIPARKGGQAVTAWVEVPIAFKLEN